MRNISKSRTVMNMRSWISGRGIESTSHRVAMTLERIRRWPRRYEGTHHGTVERRLQID